MMAQLWQNWTRVVEIPPSGEPPDDRIEKDSLSTLKAMTTTKELNVHLHVNCACAICVASKWHRASNFAESQLSYTHYSCDFAVKRAERGYYDENVLCGKYVAGLICKLCQSVRDNTMYLRLRRSQKQRSPILSFSFLFCELVGSIILPFGVCSWFCFHATFVSFFFLLLTMSTWSCHEGNIELCHSHKPHASYVQEP